ncbi:patatin family protein [Mycoplasmatota bacterium zrk1]
MKKGLVLEGGGIRGVFTTGVLDAFMDNFIEFDYVLGVSVGVTNGCNYITKQRGRGYRVLNNFVNDHRYMSLRNYLKTGNYFGWDWIFNDLQLKLDEFDYEKFHKSDVEMIANITNCETGLSEFYKINGNENFEKIYRASHAIPVITNPVNIMNSFYLDGGISESIPLKRAFYDNCDKVLVISTKVENYSCKPIKSHFLRMYYRKYPKIYDALINRHTRYMKEREYLKTKADEGLAFTIYPKKSTHFVSRVEKDLKKINKLYEIGYREGLKQIDKINLFFSSD